MGRPVKLLCVFFTLNSSFCRRHSAHPVSVPIHPSYNYLFTGEHNNKDQI